MSACEAPIAWDELVDYWAGDMELTRVDAIDEHLMGCGACSALSARVSAVTEALRVMIPPVIDRARLETLRGGGYVIADNTLLPDERRIATFAAETDLLIHHLAGLDLSEAERVGITISVEESGVVLMEVPAVPFDRESGEVLVACQRHFVAFPPNIVVEVRAHTRGGGERVARYPIPHVFERRAGETP